MLLIRAKARPLAAAKKARALLDKMGVETISGITEDVYFRDGREGPLERYREVPHILTRPCRPALQDHLHGQLADPVDLPAQTRDTHR